MSSHIIRHHILGQGSTEVVNPNPSYKILTEDSDFLVTEDGDNLITE